MPSIKITISIPEPLFHRAEAVAHSLQISRSQLIARVVDEFVKRYESRILLESLNRAYFYFVRFVLAVETLYLAAPPPGHKCPG
jgi:metal-responsive CopG/Arc/MetJ family transcriptional regulator